MADDRLDGHLELLKDLYPHTGNAWVLGVTGNPGAGKSTLTDRLVQSFRGEGKRVGVVAVDPSSPFTGGAILGDRIRMQRHFEDPEVFIRSLATRGTMGGLSQSATDVVRVLDAWGADVIVVETVGVGQDELEVTRAAHTTLVVMAPGMGDEVQAIKAGILECADVFAVNKADRDGVDSAVRDLELMIALGKSIISNTATSVGHIASTVDIRRTPAAKSSDDPWTPSVVRTVATRNEGLKELIDRLVEHRNWLLSTSMGAQRMRIRLQEQMHGQMREALIDAAIREIGEGINEAVARVAQRQLDPYSACERLVEAFRCNRSL